MLGVILVIIFDYVRLFIELEWVVLVLMFVILMFLYGGFMYLVGNMFYFWIFGNNIEDVMGWGCFLVFYLFCGIVVVLV